MYIQQNTHITAQLANQNKDALHRLQKAFGGGVYRGEGAFRWMINSRKALHFLQSIYPYIKIKKPQATVAIYFQLKIYPHRSWPLSKAELQERAEWVQTLKRLNRAPAEKFYREVY